MYFTSCPQSVQALGCVLSHTVIFFRMWMEFSFPAHFPHMTSSPHWQGRSQRRYFYFLYCKLNENEEMRQTAVCFLLSVSAPVHTVLVKASVYLMPPGPRRREGLRPSHACGELPPSLGDHSRPAGGCARPEVNLGPGDAPQL